MIFFTILTSKIRKPTAGAVSLYLCNKKGAAEAAPS